MSEPTDQRLIAELVSGVLARHARAAERSSGAAPPERELWSQLEELGLTLAAVPEDLGGSGGSVEDELTILRTAGAYPSSPPLLETALAGWLLSAAGILPGAGPMAVAPVGFGDRISAQARGGGPALIGISTATGGVREAQRLVVSGRDDAGEAWVAVVDVDAPEHIPTVSSAGEPRTTLRFDGVPGAVTRVDDRAGPEQLLRRGALGRCVMIVGAAERIRDLTVRHTAERRQFGRPLRTFQAVEHQLAIMARECALADAMTAAAGAALVSDGRAPLAEVAAAKVVCGRAASTVAAIAHQLHGAIGITREHALPGLTRAMLSWRDDFGGERAWSTALGRELLASEPWDRLSVTGRIGDGPPGFVAPGRGIGVGAPHG